MTATKRRILFVDDEKSVLNGLRRMLGPMRGEWDMSFAESGQDTLEQMGRGAFDVIVSDMRMPAMTGVELLEQVAKKHPWTVRIILSGHSDTEMTLKAAGLSHQFMSKPCNAELLKSRVARCCGLRDLLSDGTLLELTSKMKSLPSLPTLYNKILQAMEAGDGSTESVGRIIAEDVSMTAKVLQLVNSSFFGLGQRITTPDRAATFLGLNTIKSLVLSAEVFSQFDTARVKGFSLESLWNHSFTTGAYARAIAREQKAGKDAVDAASLAGLLHDAGKLVLCANMPEQYSAVIDLQKNEGLTATEAERQVLGTSHAEVGGYLLGIWGIPEDVVEAIACHHEPNSLPHESFCVLTAVHVANQLDDAADGDMDEEELGVDLEYLERIGCRQHLSRWREQCLTQTEEECAK